MAEFQSGGNERKQKKKVVEESIRQHLDDLIDKEAVEEMKFD